MTQEEAIEVVRKNLPHLGIGATEMTDALGTLIPELAESEDERIRKSLVQTLQLAKCNDGKLVISDTLAGKYLAWLEKQKEPLPIPDKFSELNSLLLQYFQSAVKRNDDTEIESDTDLWGRKILDYVRKHDEKQKESLGDFIDDFPYSDEQKEQKPKEQCVDVIKMSTLLAADRLASAEMTGRLKERKEILENPEKYGLCKPAECEDCAMYLSGNCIHPNGKCENVKSKQEWSEEDKRILNRIYSIIGWAMDEHAFSSCKKLLGDKEGVELQDFLRSIAKPKQEWSEEDKEKIVTISEIIEHCTTIPYSGGTLTLNKEYKKELLCFIKSLRPQPQGVYKQVVHSIFKMLKDKNFYGMPLSNCASLLNDIRVKCKDADECAEILDDPSWKPSEVQMEALEAATVRYQSTGLESLYEDLKKL